jgi:hypothetical protein
MAKIITLILIIVGMWYLVKITSTTPPSSTYFGRIDLSMKYSLVKLQPQNNSQFVINIVPDGGFVYLLGGPSPCRDMKISIKIKDKGFLADRDVITASCLYDDRLTLMVWNNKYGSFYNGMDEVLIQVENESKIFEKCDVYIMHVP